MAKVRYKYKSNQFNQSTQVIKRRRVPVTHNCINFLLFRSVANWWNERKGDGSKANEDSTPHSARIEQRRFRTAARISEERNHSTFC